jgi:DNA-directed RNA polymerase sigma subunit (sigma70/sigma32)
LSFVSQPALDLSLLEAAQPRREKEATKEEIAQLIRELRDDAGYEKRSKAMKYLEEIGGFSPLHPEEEIDLARKIRKGDEESLDKLVKANLRFVISVAKEYQGQGLPLSDLISEGNLGLIKAAQRFDETRGFKFISYAVWWIRQSILQALAEQSRVVRLPLNRVGAINKIGRALEFLEKAYGREPSLAEIATKMEMSTYDVTDVVKTAARHDFTNFLLLQTLQLNAVQAAMVPDNCLYSASWQAICQFLPLPHPQRRQPAESRSLKNC